MVDVADPETAPFSVVDKPAPDAVVGSAVEETKTVVDPPATVDPLKNVVVGKGVVVGGGGTLGSRLSTRNISPSDSITTIVPVASLTSEYRPTDSGTIDNRRSGPPMFIGTLKFTSCVPTNTSTSSVGKSGEWKLTASPSAITDTPLKHANALPTHGSSVPLIDSRPSVVFRRSNVPNLENTKLNPSNVVICPGPRANADDHAPSRLAAGVSANEQSCPSHPLVH